MGLWGGGGWFVVGRGGFGRRGGGGHRKRNCQKAYTLLIYFLERTADRRGVGNLSVNV